MRELAFGGDLGRLAGAGLLSRIAVEEKEVWVLGDAYWHYESKVRGLLPGLW